MDEATITVFSPATVANVACGFDIFGFALDYPGDELTLTLTQSKGVRLSVIKGDEGKLPLNPLKNAATVSLQAFLDHIHFKGGFEVELHKKMPLGSGLGSSAASAAGSLFAANELLGRPLALKDLIPFAMEGERACTTFAHADNVAPALLGGFTLIRSYDPLEVISLECPLELYCSIVHPKIEILTEQARKLLKSDVTLKQLVEQTGNAAGLTAGLLKGDSTLISHSLKDVVIEPIRAALIPGFYAIQKAALDHTALGCSISGSGPSIFALSLAKEHAEAIGKAMKNACKQYQECDLYVSKINYRGPRIIE